MKNIQNYLPGLIISLLIASLARFIESLMPIHLIGSSVIALFIGMILNQIFPPSSKIQPGLIFTSKKILKLSIILLGSSLSIGTILTIGRLSLTVMFFTLLTCFGGGYFIGKWLGLDWKLSNLISAGTGICGGSAIAALASVIKAEDKDIAYAISATFLFDIIMIILFPLMGHHLELSDIAYGLWAGTAVNDTSSVVAAGYAFSESAGDFATMVKLTRTLSIIPTVLIFSLINIHVEAKKSFYKTTPTTTSPAKITNFIPWFILAFISMSLLNSFGLFSLSLSKALKSISKFLMVSALAAIGLNTNFKEIKKSGIRPMVHGFIISILVVIVAILVEYFIGLI